MLNIYCRRGFTDLIKTLKDENKMSSVDLEKLILESIREVLGMLFGKQIAPVIEGSLEIDDEKDGFDPARFIERLEMLFGKDAGSVRIMIEGKMLTKYHQQEFMKNLGLPIVHYDYKA